MQKKTVIPSILALQCGFQNYPWGKPGEQSFVYKLLKSSKPANFYDTTLRYAELWMGTHKSMPSQVILDKDLMSLKTLIEQNPEVMLGKAYEQYNKQLCLPFLFKVLSVDCALSIQAHPDKKLAEELMEKNPNLYKDNNHKPELAIALTQFEALCNFCDKQQIIENCQNTPEIYQVIDNQTFQQFVQEKNEDKNKELLKALITQLFNQKKQIVEQSITQMVQRISTKSNQSKRDKLILSLNKQFPLDIGIFVSNFLNYLTLQPGESISMLPDEPHAYIQGDCIECMSNSDNVVRAGLTPKQKDVNTLIKMLTYKMGATSKIVPENKSQTNNYQLLSYSNIFTDFCCYSFEAQNNVEQSCKIKSGNPMILIAVQVGGKDQPKNGNSKNCIICDGLEKEIIQGSIFYILPGTKFSFKVEKSTKLYICSCYDDQIEIV